VNPAPGDTVEGLASGTLNPGDRMVLMPTRKRYGQLDNHRREPRPGRQSARRKHRGGSSTKDDSLADKATFFAGSAIRFCPGVDYGVRHIVSRTSTPGILFAYLASPPAAGSFTFDILLSQDGVRRGPRSFNHPISIIRRTSSSPPISSRYRSRRQSSASGCVNGRRPGFANGFQGVLHHPGDHGARVGPRHVRLRDRRSRQSHRTSAATSS